jgi:predicted regulator of Ras-like GTPase activity (Roadblock/LC7/MglB family)
MKALPEGKSLGWMQAPSSWISSHTVRFIGVVRVVIQDGEGFILIKKGRPLFHYFKHGTIELKGHTALDYFNSHPVIEFNLCKYTPDEFAWAMKICNIEDHEPVVPREPAVPGPGLREHNASSRPVDTSVIKSAGDKRTPDPAVVSPQVYAIERKPAVPQPVSREHNPPPRMPDPPIITPAGDKRTPDPAVISPQVHTVEKNPAVPQPVSRDLNAPPRMPDPPVTTSAGDKRIPDPAVVSPKVHTVEKKPAVPQPVSREHNAPPGSAEPPVIKPVADKRTLNPLVVTTQVHTVEKRAVILPPVAGDDPEVTAISQIRDMEGIVAISVFNDSGTVLLKGDADNEAMVKIAQTMLGTSKKITPLLTWGPFVHMTIQIPSGNMIIAPYHDQYLCLLTTRTINIGHIRRILRDLQQKGAPQRMS